MAALTSSSIAITAAWTQVSTSKATVILTNPLSLPLQYAVAATSSDLNGVIGHEFNRLETVTLTDLGTSGNNVFVKAAGGSGILIVTAY